MPARRRPTQPTTRPPETKGERTRAAILGAGYRLFLRQGYTATSMRQIADAAGLAPGAAYNHFHGKEAIFLAILREHHPLLQILPAMQAAQGDTVEALVHDAATRMIEALGQRQEALNLMYIELVEFKAKHAPQLFKMFFPAFMEMVQRFAQAKGKRRNIPLPTMMRSFLGLFFSYFMTERLIGDQLPAEWRAGAFDHFVDIYLHGILAKG